MENVVPANQQYHWNNSIMPMHVGINQSFMSNPPSIQPISQPIYQQNTEAVNMNFAHQSDSMQRRLQTPDLNDVIWGRKGRWVRCPHCYQCVTTSLTYIIGPMAIFIALLCLVCFFPLVWIPFYTNFYKDVQHSCPACGKRIGLYTKSFGFLFRIYD